MQEKRKEQSSVIELKKEDLYPKKGASPRQGWRELGAYFQVYFRLQANGHFELFGNILKGQDMEALGQLISKHLECELAVQKRSQQENSQ